MSYLVTLKVPGDVEAFKRSLTERADDLKAIGDKARAGGAIHHRFGLGEGFVHVTDEWASPQEFEAFFTEPSMQEFIATIGADTSVPPEIVISEAIDSPDQF